MCSFRAHTKGQSVRERYKEREEELDRCMDSGCEGELTAGGKDRHGKKRRRVF